MKLHSDILSVDDLVLAAITCRRDHKQDIQVDEYVSQGSRKRHRGITFYAYSLCGKRATNRGRYDHNGSSQRAASWTAYGYLIAELFKRDPHAIIGYYKSPEDFAKQCRSYTPKGESLAFLDILKLEGSYI